MEGRLGGNLLYAIRGNAETPERAILITIDDLDIAALKFHANTLAESAPDLADCLDEQSMEALDRLRSVSDLPRSVHACAGRSAANPKRF